MDVSLLGSGLWSMGQAIAVSQHLDRAWQAPPVGSHGSPMYPDTLQLRDDGQICANEYVLPAGELNLVSSPVQFDVTAPELRPAPEFAAQTEEILTELGMDWDRIVALKTAGAVT